MGAGTVCELYDPAVTEVGVVASAAITEASGLVASRSYDAYWVINDSGNDPVLYAVAPDGGELAAIPIEGALSFDWEDIALGPGPEAGVDYVYVGDIGDNLRLRTSIELVRMAEPDPRNPPAAVTSPQLIHLAYPGGAQDSEALWVDPITGDVFLVTKGQDDGRSVVYRAAADTLGGADTITMEQFATFTFGNNVSVTAADVTADGAVLAWRGYHEVWMWLRRDLDYAETLALPPCMAPSPEEIQGEALAFVPDGLSFMTLSEGSAKPLNLVAVRTP